MRLSLLCRLVVVIRATRCLAYDCDRCLYAALSDLLKEKQTHGWLGDLLVWWRVAKPPSRRHMAKPPAWRFDGCSLQGPAKLQVHHCSGHGRSDFVLRCSGSSPSMRFHASSRRFSKACVPSCSMTAFAAMTLFRREFSRAAH